MGCLVGWKMWDNMIEVGIFVYVCGYLDCSFAMHELGLSSRKPFKKCARVVGEVRFFFVCSNKLFV